MEVDVALVSMPFGPVFSPSIGVSLLCAELAEHHLAARVHHFTIRFAELIGQAFYSGIAEDNHPALEDLAGEWLFSKALFGADSVDDTNYIEEMLAGYYSDALIARLQRAVDHVEFFLAECLETLLRDKPRVVGFSSMFQQHNASLALARRLKQASPSTPVVFGGANCEGIMGAETVRSFPFVDAAVSGEADLIFPQLVRRLIDGGSVTDIPGVRTREGIAQDFASGVFSNGPMVRELDRLPVPDYGDYFEQFKASRYDREWQPSVFFETARGCWWGERTQCTFCGLNRETIGFRSKSPTRALREVTQLALRYPGCDLQAVDNILDLDYFRNFLPALATRRRRLSLFYETKSNLTKDHVRQLRRAGVRDIQPGIESFSNPVLKLMRKGVTGLQNIQLLKWCKELGVRPLWNVLWGFPGEPAEEYTRLADLVPLLTHLPPPLGNARIRLDRFSPNFVDADRFRFANVKPIPAYEHIYRLDERAVANLAYYFAYTYAEPRDVDQYTHRFAREVEKWRHVARRSDLLCVDAGEHLVIIDTRPVSRTPFRVLSGLVKELYRECDAVRDLSQLSHAAAQFHSVPPSTTEIEQMLAPLVEQGLVLRDGSRYLALAIPVGEYSPPAATSRRFATTLKEVGVSAGKRWIVPTAKGHVHVQRSGSRACKVPPLAAARFSVGADGELIVEQFAAATSRKGAQMAKKKKKKGARGDTNKGKRKTKKR